MSSDNSVPKIRTEWSRYSDWPTTSGAYFHIRVNQLAMLTEIIAASWKRSYNTKEKKMLSEKTPYKNYLICCVKQIFCVPKNVNIAKCVLHVIFNTRRTQKLSANFVYYFLTENKLPGRSKQKTVNPCPKKQTSHFYYDILPKQ